MDVSFSVESTPMHFRHKDLRVLRRTGVEVCVAQRDRDRRGLMAGKWSYASVEWVWAGSQIRMNFPGQPEQFREGSYQDVVELLTQLGNQGWEVCGCIGVADWIYWTLKYHHVS